MIGALNRKRTAKGRQRVLPPVQCRHAQQLELSQEKTHNEGGSTDSMS
jgi:hypothetical protein